MQNKVLKIGDTFGYLTILSERFKVKLKSNYYSYLCKCLCGKEKTVREYNLKSGHTKSCGCYKIQRIKEAVTKNGLSHEKLYMTWRQMFYRCYNKKSKSYKSYGGRGIDICKKWHKYENFRKDMGQHPIGYQIDRIDNNKGYCKKNCRWVTLYENLQNTRKCIIVEIDGEKRSLSDHARRNGILVGTVMSRIKIGWSYYDAIKTPINKKFRYKGFVEREIKIK